MERQFEKVSPSFEASITQISAHQQRTDNNFENLFTLLESANIFQTGCPTLNEPSVVMHNTLYTKDNPPNDAEPASSPN
jgi:hypothetical protein